MGCASSSEEEPPARQRRSRAGSTAGEDGNVERIDLNRQPSKSAIKRNRTSGGRRVSWATAEELRKSAADIEREEGAVEADGEDHHPQVLASPTQPGDNAQAMKGDGSAFDGDDEAPQKPAEFDGVAPSASDNPSSVCEPADAEHAANPLQEPPSGDT